MNEPTNIPWISLLRLSTFLIILAVLFVPFKILSYGFLPGHDVLRHTAQAVSGKDWNEILIPRSDIKMDSHPGWHKILSVVHKVTRWDTYELAHFSVVFLFVLFSLIPIILLRRPETWMLALIIMDIANQSLVYRLLTGRPYIVTMTAVSLLCILWPKLQDKKVPYRSLVAITVSVAASTWIHCSWYLFVLPVAAFFIAGQKRAGLVAAICAVVGIITGAALTGNPVLFLKQTLHHLFLALRVSDN